jgi:hypothetical protein
MFLFFRSFFKESRADIDYQIALSNEFIFPSGTGYKNIILNGYPPKKRKSPCILVYKKMKL